MTDRFNADFINSRAWLVRLWDGTEYPLIDFCVTSGFLSFDVCGLKENSDIDFIDRLVCIDSGDVFETYELEKGYEGELINDRHNVHR